MATTRHHIYRLQSESTYLSGRGMVGYISRMTLTRSELWVTTSTMQYLPFAEGTSYARTCARATSLTFTQPKVELGYVDDPARKWEGFALCIFSFLFLAQTEIQCSCLWKQTTLIFFPRNVFHEGRCRRPWKPKTAALSASMKQCLCYKLMEPLLRCKL